MSLWLVSGCHAAAGCARSTARVRTLTKVPKRNCILRICCLLPRSGPACGCGCSLAPTPPPAAPGARRESGRSPRFRREIASCASVVSFLDPDQRVVVVVHWLPRRRRLCQEHGEGQDGRHGREEKLHLAHLRLSFTYR